MIPPASAVPIFFDLPRMSALCTGLGERPPSRPTPYAGWEDFCLWATEQVDPQRWRDRLVSFVRWQGARDGTLIEILRPRSSTDSLRRAWLTALSHPDGALFAGWLNMRTSSDESAGFTNREGRRERYVTLRGGSQAFTAVLSGSGLLDDQIASRSHLHALSAGRLSPVLLVGNMDRSRMLTPALVAVGCS